MGGHPLIIRVTFSPDPSVMTSFAYDPALLIRENVGFGNSIIMIKVASATNHDGPIRIIHQKVEEDHKDHGGHI
jgi:hypothetical protein